MKDMTPNIPEVVEEVRQLFERYEQALIDKNVEVLDATFWNSPHTIRLANHEHGYGFDRIHAHRVARVPGPGTKAATPALRVIRPNSDLECSILSALTASIARCASLVALARSLAGATSTNSSPP